MMHPAYQRRVRRAGTGTLYPDGSEAAVRSQVTAAWTISHWDVRRRRTASPLFAFGLSPGGHGSAWTLRNTRYFPQPGDDRERWQAERGVALTSIPRTPRTSSGR